MKRLIIALTLVMLLCSVAFSQSKKEDKTLSLINGTWETSTAAYDGSEVEISGMSIPVKMHFENGKFKMWTEEKEFFGDYTLDVTKNPKWITLSYDGNTGKPFQGSSFRGLFSLEDGILTMVTNIERRPLKLSAESTSLNTMLILVRETDEDDDDYPVERD